VYCTTTEASSNRTTGPTTIRSIAQPCPPVTRTRYARRRRCGTGCRRSSGRDEEGPPRSIRTTGAPRSGQLPPSNGYTTRSLTDGRISPSADYTHTRGLGRAKWAKVILLLLLSSSAYRSTEAGGSCFSPVAHTHTPPTLSRVSRIGSARSTQVDPTSNIYIYIYYILIHYVSVVYVVVLVGCNR
jgi:hypothetical protein